MPSRDSSAENSGGEDLESDAARGRVDVGVSSYGEQRQCGHGEGECG